MADTKFTPGPWLSDRGTDWVVASEPHDAGDIICDLPPLPFEQSRVRWDANAALIATAPELYEASRLLVSALDAAGLLNLTRGVELGQTVWYVKAKTAVDYARAALAKARGEPA